MLNRSLRILRMPAWQARHAAKAAALRSPPQGASARRCHAGLAQLVEHLICNLLD